MRPHLLEYCISVFFIAYLITESTLFIGTRNRMNTYLDRKNQKLWNVRELKKAKRNRTLKFYHLLLNKFTLIIGCIMCAGTWIGLVWTTHHILWVVNDILPFTTIAGFGILIDRLAPPSVIRTITKKEKS